MSLLLESQQVLSKRHRCFMSICNHVWEQINRVLRRAFHLSRIVELSVLLFVKARTRSGKFPANVLKLVESEPAMPEIGEWHCGTTTGPVSCHAYYYPLTGRIESSFLLVETGAIRKAHQENPSSEFDDIIRYTHKLHVAWLAFTGRNTMFTLVV